MIYNLSLCKNKYLEFNNKTILDKTPFQDFIINCKGFFLVPTRHALLQKYIKKKKGLRLNFRYDPTGKKIQIPNFIFENTSGNIIINNKNLILKN